MTIHIERNPRNQIVTPHIEITQGAKLSSETKQQNQTARKHKTKNRIDAQKQAARPESIQNRNIWLM